MEKKWLLRLPRDLDDWLTLKAAKQTVKRGKRVSKNTLLGRKRFRILALNHLGQKGGRR
jgi:hypothetical protein